MTQTVSKTISKIGRLGGALLAETNGEYYLIGELKEPCNFEDYGFEKPVESDSEQKMRYRKIKAIRPFPFESEYLEMEAQGEALAELLFKRFVVFRNHSVSERLWRVATSQKKENGVTDARWLEQIPDEVWEIVRENVLRCL